MGRVVAPNQPWDRVVGCRNRLSFRCRPFARAFDEKVRLRAAGDCGTGRSRNGCISVHGFVPMLVKSQPEMFSGLQPEMPCFRFSDREGPVRVPLWNKGSETICDIGFWDLIPNGTEIGPSVKTPYYKG